MRLASSSGALLITLSAACAPSAPPEPPNGPPPPPALTGTVGGRPFAARSALMVSANYEGTGCSTAYSETGGCSSRDPTSYRLVSSIVRVFERPVTCVDVNYSNGMHDVELASGERSVDILIHGRWPMFPGSIWKVDRQGPNSPTDDQMMVAFQVGGAGSGSSAFGEIHVLEATPERGTFDVRVSTPAPGGAVPGSISGTVPFIVCARK